MRRGYQYRTRRVVGRRLRQGALDNRLILDRLSVAPVVAFALRRLSTGYTGPLIRVRRSSDNAEQDIGATSTGVLDTSSLLSFTGAGNGVVTTWYDQSGNTRNATQTTPSAQPRIVNAGVLDVDGSKPAMFFGGTNAVWTSALTLFPSAFSVNFVGRVTSDGDFRMIVSKANTVHGAPFDLWTGLTQAQCFVSNGLGGGTISDISTARMDVASGRCNWTFQGSLGSGNVNLWRNGTQAVSGVTATNYADTGGLFGVGSRADGTCVLIGYATEVIGFDSLLSTTNRQTLERDQGSFYGISVA